MTEKKTVVEAIRFNYNGMFNMGDLFKEVDDWTDKNGYERETKKKLEHVDADSKKIDVIFELWNDLTDWARSVVRLRVLGKDIIDFDLERNGYKREMQKGHILIIIDGFLETDIEHRWSEKPWYVFVRTVWDKWVWKFHLDRYDGPVITGCKGLFNQLEKHLKKYKH